MVSGRLEWAESNLCKVKPQIFYQDLFHLLEYRLSKTPSIPWNFWCAINSSLAEYVWNMLIILLLLLKRVFLKTF